MTQTGQAAPKKRVAVFISGSGSNLAALIDAARDDDYPVEIALVLSNKADAYGLIRAADAGIQTAFVDHRAYDSREAFEDAITVVLSEQSIDIICLAGFMRILTAGFVSTYEGRMINVHPSLLPDYKGLQTHSRVLEAGERYHGCSVHFVQAELDGGPVILQARIPVLEDDTPDSLAGRVLVQEHRIYPAALSMLGAGAVTFAEPDVVISGRDAPIVITDKDSLSWRDLIHG